MCYIKQTISVKIFVTCVTNSSRHRKRFVRNYIHSLFVSKALTRLYFAPRVLTKTTREYLVIIPQARMSSVELLTQRP